MIMSISGVFDGGGDKEPSPPHVTLEREHRLELGNPVASGEQWQPERQLLCLERPVLDPFYVVEGGQRLEHR